MEILSKFHLGSYRIELNSAELLCLVWTKNSETNAKKNKDCFGVVKSNKEKSGKQYLKYNMHIFGSLN